MCSAALQPGMSFQLGDPAELKWNSTSPWSKRILDLSRVQRVEIAHLATVFTLAMLVGASSFD